MKTWMLALTAALALFALAGCSENTLGPDRAADLSSDPAFASAAADANGGVAVIANRGSGTISVIDAETLDVSTYDLPAEDGDDMPMPMYVVQVNSRIFVGDRANNRLVVFNRDSFEVMGTVPAGAGVFHMWADPIGRQLWVNNDIDNTMTVIDPKNMTVLGTVALPMDIVDMGGKPHDVFLGPRGKRAYVSVVGIDGPNDYVLMFDTRSFEELARRAVGKDPHLSMARHSDLYVPCQNSDQVLVLDPATLAIVDEISVPGAHGAIMSKNGKYFYTTNLPNGGADALYTISTRSNDTVGAPVMTPYAVPHNLALSPNGKQLFVTHSGGASDKVTVYTMQGNDPVPVYAGEVTVGTNPFGLAFVN